MSAPDMSAVPLVRRFYRALAVRDVDGALACFAPDATWRVPGNSAVAGVHLGHLGVGEFLADLERLSGGTFSAELLDVTAGDRFVVAVQHATAHFRGRRLDVTACQLIETRDGLIGSVRGHYSDQAQLDAFWDGRM